MRLLNKRLILLVFSLSIFPAVAKPVNVVLITADDLGYESVASLGNSIPDLTPNLDTFADQGVQFHRAHVNSPICQPSRANLATGLYSINSGMMGFIHMKKPSPTVMQTLSDNGYITGIIGKIHHSNPDLNYTWDFVKDRYDLDMGRNPQKYYHFIKQFLERSKKEKKPFYLMVNSHDPHRPFYDPEDPKRWGVPPSKLFTTEDVKVPGYLPDILVVREELSHYYNSIRRLDDTFGKVIQALNESGMIKNTLIMFLSDNGSAFPFAKANTYLASSKTPWLVHWPENIRGGQVDDEHFISGIDFFPTVLDALDLPIPESLDGRSFLPLMQGKKQRGRQYVYTQIDYKNSGPARPMRAVQNEKYGYIFNPWSREGAAYRNGNEGKITKAMALSNDENQLARLKMFRERVPEEFYDLERDPDCLNNLIDNPKYKNQLKAFRSRLKRWMVKHNDPALVLFENKDSPETMAKLLEHDFPKKEDLMPQAQKDGAEALRQEKSRRYKAWERRSQGMIVK